MRIGVISPQSVPPAFGGLERALEGLVDAIKAESPNDAELVRLPVDERTLVGLVAAYQTFSQLDVSRFDMVITTKYPAWLVRHPNHAVYMFHRLRGLYDAYDFFGLPEHIDHDEPDLARLQAFVRTRSRPRELAEFFELFASTAAARGPDDPALALPGPLAREIVRFLDGAALDPRWVRRFFALSKTVAARRDYFPARAGVEVVYLPSSLQGLHCDRFRHFFTVSRLDEPKRIELIIRALGHVSHDIPLKIAGTGADVGRLREQAAGDPRISFLGAVSDEELVEGYADAIAVPFTPSDEDLGLVALEAMMSSKPVVTCLDSGGPTEFVTDGVNGFVTEPTPAAVGRALERLACDRAFAERLGAAGNERAGQVSWRRTVRALLRDARPRRRSISPRGKPKIVVAATFLAEPALHGGQIRLLHLCKALTASYDVEIVSLVEADRSRKRTILRDGLAQSAIPKTPAHAHADAEASRSVGGLHVTDILASETVSLTPSYVEALGSAAAGAAGIVLSHPYLVTAVEAIDAAVPLVYEAQDVESDLKRALLPTSEVGDRLYALVEAVEEKAVGISVLTTTCSQEDADALVQRFGAASSSLVVIPNGVELEAIAYVSTEPRRRSAERWLRSYAASGPSAAGEFRELCVFFGSAHPPNVDAAEQILRFAARRPTTLFAIVGSLCGELNGRTRPENVLLAGVVSPVVKHGLLASAHVGLNPVRIGSGTNLKLVEYLAAGLPVVTTRFGARGLPGDGDGIAAVADVEDFPRAIEQVLVNRATTRERVRRGRALVESGFDWELLGRRFTTAVETALASEA